MDYLKYDLDEILTIDDFKNQKKSIAVILFQKKVQFDVLISLLQLWMKEHKQSLK